MIDMKALQRVQQGNRSSRIAVAKRWLIEVADILERLSVYRHEPYDTSAIRMLAGGDATAKVTVTRGWLANIYDEITTLQGREQLERQPDPLDDKQSRLKDAFLHTDKFDFHGPRAGRNFMWFDVWK